MNHQTCPTCSGLGWVDASLPAGETRKRSRRTAPDTSVEAAVRINPATARAVHLELLATLSRHEDGLADFELADCVRRNASTLRARRSELMHADMVIDSGQRRRVPDTNVPSIVWVITDIGRLALTLG